MTGDERAVAESGIPKSGVPAELLHPNSVVIVGPSADRTKLSNKPLTNLLAVGYLGRVYVVNPGAKEVEGVASDELVDVLIKLQREALRIGLHLSAIEINPLWTGNGKSMALDALVVIAGPPAAKPTPKSVAEEAH